MADTTLATPEPPKKPKTPQDAIDFASLWQDPGLGDGITTGNYHTIPVGKPKDFFRTHPDQAYRRRTEIYTHKPEGAIDEQTYIIAPAMQGRIEEAQPCTLVTVVYRDGSPRIWPVKLPRDGEKDNNAWESARAAARVGLERWTGKFRTVRGLIPIFVCALKASLQLKQELPNSRVKLRLALLQSNCLQVGLSPRPHRAWRLAERCAYRLFRRSFDSEYFTSRSVSTCDFHGGDIRGQIARTIRWRRTDRIASVFLLPALFGKLVGDLIGSGASQEQAIVGETPNLAARLQGVAEPNSVLIAESTRKLLGNLFQLEDLGTQDLKGIVAPIRAWAALRPATVESRFDALHTTSLTELVGREEELELLLRRWSKAKSGEGQVVLLSGEAGIGKSHPIISQMERAAGFTHDDTVQTKLNKLDAVLAQSLTSPEDAALFAEALSLPNDGRYPKLELTPQQRRQKTLEGFTAQLEALARSKPVLMIFEDIHWVDPTSLEALGRTVDRIRGLGVLLIGTHRAEFQPPWIGRPYVSVLTLNRLDEREIAAMIDRIVGNKPLPTNVRQDIMERTDGVPLFVEEMTKALLEAEGEDAVERTVTAAPSPSANVPASLHASLMARLDRLGPAKAVAQIGAVIGREFSHALLREVTSEPELSAALDRLVAAGLLFRQGVSPHATYLFNHALIQEAAYQSLLKSRRQLHHARIADVLEAQFAEAVEPELIAYHLTQAGRIEQATDYWLKAGQRAMQRSANIEAERHLRVGIDLLAGLPETATRPQREITLQNTLGVCLMPTRGFGNPEVAAAFDRAAEICARVGDDRGLFIALRGKGQYHMISGDLRTAREDARRILELAEQVGNHDFLIEAHHLGWSTLCFAGEFRAAQRHAEEGISRYERERDHHLTYTYSGHDPGMCAHAFGSLSLAQLGYSERALSWCRDGLAHAEALAHPFTLGIALWGSGSLHQLRREPDAMRQIGERMIQYGKEKSLRMAVPYGKFFQGNAIAEHGEFAEGIAQMREGISESRSMGTLFSLVSFLAGLADAYAHCGNIDEGLAVIEEGLAMMRTGGEHFSLPEIHRIKGKLLLAGSAHDTDTAEAAFAEALSIARAQQAKLLELRASMSLARLWRDQGKVQQARELLAPVYGWFTEGFDTLDLKEAKALLEELAV